MLKLEIGKTYKARNGSLHKITAKYLEMSFPFLSSEGLSFRENGTYFDCYLPSQKDLIEEAIEPPFNKLSINNSTCKITVNLVDGIKLDQGKEPLDLLSPIAIFELTKVLQFGAKKYAAYNWAKGISYSRCISALLRHVFKYMSGESKDPETGISHVAHAMANCMFLLHYEVYRQEFDDRPKEVYTKTVSKMEEEYK